MGRRRKSVVGHRYYFGTHMGIGRGPIDAVVEVQVGDRTAWTGSLAATGAVVIDKPNLFGGDDKEGGIAGTLTLLMGDAGQTVHGGLAAMLGGLVPAFRGVATVFFDGLMCSGGPYPKPWKFRVRRALKGWHGDNPWYPAKAVVPMGPQGAIQAMNPAHILYECWTNPDWGRGLARARLDNASWTAAADQLHAEGFGLCIKWSRQDTLASFMQGIIDHIGAAQYPDRTTGLIVLKLIRDDYNASTLPQYTPTTGLLGIDDDEVGAQPAATNEVVVRYKDPLTNQQGQVRVRNLAAIHAANGGGVNTTTKDYPGVPTPQLALRLAQRDLKASSGFLKKFRVRLDRRAYRIAPGSVFRIADTDRGIFNIVLRAGRVEYGTLTEGTITVVAIQDVFGLPATSFVGVQQSGYLPPDTTPAAIVDRRVLEAPYRDLAVTNGPANAAQTPATAGFLAAIATRPTSLSLSFDLLDRVGTSGAFVNRGTGAFCPSGVLTAAMTRQTTLIVVSGGVGLDQVAAGSAALIDDEIVRVASVNASTGEVTLARGCVDTVPAPHAAGARVFFYDGFGAASPTEYTAGVTVQAKLLARTGAGTFDETAATTDSLLFAQRQARPYPPGRLTVNGRAYPAAVVGTEVSVAWAHRDRVAQADQLVDSEAGNVGPESGTTYRLRFYSGTVLRRTYTGVAGTAQAYLAAHEAADGGPFDPIRIVLDSQRSGLDSLQAHDITVARAGWGFSYGNYYGGV